MVRFGHLTGLAVLPVEADRADAYVASGLPAALLTASVSARRQGARVVYRFLTVGAGVERITVTP